MSDYVSIVRTVIYCDKVLKVQSTLDFGCTYRFNCILPSLIGESLMHLEYGAKNTYILIITYCQTN